MNQDKVREVKRILKKYADWIVDVRSRINEPDFNKALDAYCDIEEAAHQICQLFESKPNLIDPSKLTVLGEEELRDEQFDGLHFDVDDIKYVLEAQLMHTKKELGL